MSPTSARRVITIVGSGFAGTALALHLVRLLGTRAAINLVEPRAVPGPGLAYTTTHTGHLLNVRSGALSLYPDQPTHFTDWLQQQPEAAGAVPEFASRASYGRYLSEALAAISVPALPDGVQWHHTKACSALPGPDGRSLVQLANGAALASDYVILALGNFPPAPPVGPDQAYLTHPGYHADPWAVSSLACIGPQEDVMLIGSGLTAVDVLLALRQGGHQAPITVVSRHGRWPASHGPATVSYPSFYAELDGETTVSGVVAITKRHLRQATAQGLDWRPVLDAMRPDLGRIWAAWPLEEQRQFLRHLAGLWTTARHRSPPQNVLTVQELITADLVRLHAGRISEIVPSGHSLRIRVGKGAGTWYQAQHVICCTGPLLDYSRLSAPLVRSLREAGHLLPDPLGLGICTDEHGALLNAHGQAWPNLFTLGASRRPAYFESTAIPELRQQAVALATELAARLC